MAENDATLIENARNAAFSRCFRAHAQVAGIGPPPPPGRVDPLKANRLRARQIAQAVFAEPNPDMDFIGEVIGEMKNWLLPSTKIVKEGATGSGCGLRAAFVAGNRPPIHLCQPFFDSSGEQRIRTLIHEAVHLTGIGDPEGELYYARLDCLNRDPTMEFGRAKDRRRIAQADAWLKYIHCLTGQPPDREDSLSRRQPPAARVHVVQAGDYLVKLAQHYYGDGALWRKIYDANRVTIGPNPDKIYPGQRLIIP